MIQSHKLYAVAAYDMNANGDLDPAFEPRPAETAEDAIREAQSLLSAHDGVVAWSREADPAVGEYGPAEILFKSGIIPEQG